jgi:hypothetical protein
MNTAEQQKEVTSRASESKTMLRSWFRERACSAYFTGFLLFFSAVLLEGAPEDLQSTSATPTTTKHQLVLGDFNDRTNEKFFRRH